jgi:hypothetical protein
MTEPLRTITKARRRLLNAVAAASLALREGHEVHVSAPGREAGNGSALGVVNQR